MADEEIPLLEHTDERNDDDDDGDTRNPFPPVE